MDHRGGQPTPIQSGPAGMRYNQVFLDVKAKYRLVNEVAGQRIWPPQIKNQQAVVQTEKTCLSSRLIAWLGGISSSQHLLHLEEIAVQWIQVEVVNPVQYLEVPQSFHSYYLQHD